MSDAIANFLQGGKAILSAAAAQAKAQAQSDAANYNAAVNIENAGLVIQQSAEEERMSRVQSSMQIGQERANYGASGVSSAEGSPLDILQMSAGNAELDALNIRHAGQVKEWQYKSAASLDVAQAANARRAGNFGVASSLIDAASDFVSMSGPTPKSGG